MQSLLSGGFVVMIWQYWNLKIKLYLFMNVEALRAYVLKYENVTEGFPFGEDTLVFKVNNKMFLLVSLSAIPLQFNAKCAPEKAL